jgi:hypothetical protein
MTHLGNEMNKIKIILIHNITNIHHKYTIKCRREGFTPLLSSVSLRMENKRSHQDFYD